jgi:hypothetical protein
MTDTDFDAFVSPAGPFEARLGDAVASLKRIEGLLAAPQSAALDRAAAAVYLGIDAATSWRRPIPNCDRCSTAAAASCGAGPISTLT